jgi:hypothetical protein
MAPPVSQAMPCFLKCLSLLLEGRAISFPLSLYLSLFYCFAIFLTLFLNHSLRAEGILSLLARVWEARPETTTAFEIQVYFQSLIESPDIVN